MGDRDNFGTALPADFNTDGRVNILDLNLLLKEFGEASVGSDFNLSRKEEPTDEIDVRDLNRFLRYWGIVYTAP
jgi:hypothetical protein